MGYEQMENGGPFRFLAAAVSGQSHQREQGHWQRATPDQQSDQYRLENGSQHLAAEQNLSGSTIPSIQNQVGGSHRHQGHGRILSGAFLPDGERGSGPGDCVDGGGRYPEKERPDPAAEIE